MNLNEPVSAATTLFQMDFKQDVFIFLGLVYFSLLMYWLVSLKNQIFRHFQTNTAERNWIILSTFFGLCYGVMTANEWGLPYLGTSLSLGLCISLALIHPAAAACLLASSLYLRPWELIENDPYLAILPRFSIVLCIAHLFLHFAKKRKVQFEWSNLSLVLLSFTAWCFITTMVAPDSAASQGEFFDGFIKSIFLYFILVQMVRSRVSLRLLLGTLLISFLFVGLVSLYQTVGMSALSPDGDTRLKGFGAFTNSNDIAALMVFILPFAGVVALKKDENPLYRVLGAILSVVSIMTVVLSRSRGALLGIGAVIAVYLIIRIGKKAIIPVAAGLVFLMIPATIIISNRSSDDLQGSSAGRVTYLKAGIRMGFKNPILGVGFNGFESNLVNYTTESLEESKTMTAHNSWVLVFAETGIIGLVLFTLAYILCLLSAWKLYPSSPEFLLALVGYGVAMFFLSHSYLIYPYLLYALVQIAIEHRKKENELEVATE